MKDTAEYKKCVDFLRYNEYIKDHRDSVIEKNKTEVEIIYYIESNYLTSFCEKLAEKTNLAFKQEIFDMLYSGLEAFFLEKEEKQLELYPLLYFQCELDEIMLCEGIKIRRISTEEKQEIIDNVELPYLPSYDIFRYLASSKFIIEYMWGSQSGRPKASVDNVMLALSLFKPNSRIDSYGSINFTVSWLKQFGVISFPGLLAHSEKYYLTQEDSSKFLEFWDNDYLPVINNDGNFLKHAISRIYSNMHNISWINGLVDLIIVLEVIYLSQDYKKSDRLSHRCANLLGLGKNGDEKEKIRKYIKTAYVIRNDIVHEGMTEWKSLKKIDQELRPYDFVNEIYEYTRTSIIKFLSMNKYKKLYNDKGKKSQNYSLLITLLDKAIFEEEELINFLKV